MLAVDFVFNKVGPAEDCRGAEELVDAPKAIEMHVVLWQEARCTGAEDFAGGAQGFAMEELEQLEEFVVRA